MEGLLTGEMLKPGTHTYYWVLALTPAAALAHRGHRGHHQTSRHAKVRFERFGPASPSAAANAGTVMSFANGVLTLSLNNASTASGAVNSATQIACEASGQTATAKIADHGGGSGDGGSDGNGDNQDQPGNQPASASAAGTTVSNDDNDYLNENNDVSGLALTPAKVGFAAISQRPRQDSNLRPSD